MCYLTESLSCCCLTVRPCWFLLVALTPVMTPGVIMSTALRSSSVMSPASGRGHSQGYVGTFGLERPTTGQGLITQGDAAGEEAGFAVPAAGDMNGDGLTIRLLVRLRATMAALRWERPRYLWRFNGDGKHHVGVGCGKKSAADHQRCIWGLHCKSAQLEVERVPAFLRSCAYDCINIRLVDRTVAYPDMYGVRAQMLV